MSQKKQLPTVIWTNFNFPVTLKRGPWIPGNFRKWNNSSVPPSLLEGCWKLATQQTVGWEKLLRDYSGICLTYLISACGVKCIDYSRSTYPPVENERTCYKRHFIISSDLLTTKINVNALGEMWSTDWHQHASIKAPWKISLSLLKIPHISGSTGLLFQFLWRHLNYRRLKWYRNVLGFMLWCWMAPTTLEHVTTYETKASKTRFK